MKASYVWEKQGKFSGVFFRLENNIMKYIKQEKKKLKTLKINYS